MLFKLCHGQAGEHGKTALALHEYKWLAGGVYRWEALTTMLLAS